MKHKNFWYYQNKKKIKIVKNKKEGNKKFFNFKIRRKLKNFLNERIWYDENFY